MKALIFIMNIILRIFPSFLTYFPHSFPSFHLSFTYFNLPLHHFLSFSISYNIYKANSKKKKHADEVQKLLVKGQNEENVWSLWPRYGCGWLMGWFEFFRNRWTPGISSITVLIYNNEKLKNPLSTPIYPLSHNPWCPPWTISLYLLYDLISSVQAVLRLVCICGNRQTHPQLAISKKLLYNRTRHSAGFFWTLVPTSSISSAAQNFDLGVLNGSWEKEKRADFHLRETVQVG